MPEYKHGIESGRRANTQDDVVQAQKAQAVVGVAPVNLLADPMAAVNKPVVITKSADMIGCMGVSTDYKHYTLMQSYLTSIKKYGVAPVVMINVLDPSNERHITAVAGEEYELTNGCTKIKVEGIMLKSIMVSSGDTQGEEGKDYVAAFDADGYVDLAISKDGAFAGKDKVTIAFTKLNPEGVTPADIIGGTDEDGNRSGIDVIDEIYTTTTIVPSIIGAPKFSSNPAVAAALEAKAELIGALINAQAVCDVESETTKKPEQLKDAKDKLGVFARHTCLVWPEVIVGGQQISASAEKMACMQYLTMKNAGVPKSPDNKESMIEGIVLADGTKKAFTQSQIDQYAVAIGITSYVYCGGWKSWGDNTAAYPEKTDPNDASIKCVAVSNYLENRFKTEYASQIGEDTSLKAIESIINNFNYTISGLTPTYLAGGEITIDKKKTTASELRNKRIYFTTTYADYLPTEYIYNDFVWDQKYIEQAFEGGAE